MRESPHDLLPVPNPLYDNSYNEVFFYEKVVKPLIEDTVRIMANGIPINLDKVKELETYVKGIKQQDNITLHDNPLVKRYLLNKKDRLYTAKVDSVLAKHKTSEDFITKFRYDNTQHRAYFVNTVLDAYNYHEYKLDKWNIKDIKQVLTLLIGTAKELLTFYVDKKYIKIPIVYKKTAMRVLAEDKAEIYNRQRDKLLENYKVEVTFNTNSSTQLNEFFSMYGLDSLNLTKKGAMQLDRKELERQLIGVEIDLNIAELPEDRLNFLTAFKEFLTICINNSNALNIVSTFIPAFYKYTVNGYLHGTINLFGAKSFRYTSNSPNLLNLPSNGNVYAKAVKECFEVPKGYILYCVDFNGLEDRTIANLSLDKNKIAILTDPNIDGHCMASYYYVPKEIENILPKEPNESTLDYVKRYSIAVKEGNKELGKIRQDKKGCSFALAYGAFPPKIATMLQCSSEEATEIFNNYHNELYPAITELREEVVVPTVKKEGKLHLGLGCHINSYDADKDVRTLANATCQFWSILSLLAINKFHVHVDEDNLQDDIKVIASIYDSIYILVKEDSSLIKYINDTLIPIMTKDFLIDQVVPNKAEGSIGYDWYNQTTLPNEASLDTIEDILNSLKL